MKRPEITKEMILEAALKVAGEIDDEEKEEGARAIADVYRYPMDGYQLARSLEQKFCWTMSMQDAEVLDSMDGQVTEILRRAEHQWVKDCNIQPSLKSGTRIREGVIEGVCESMPARYLVKENGCTQAGRYLLVKFEDAVSAAA